MIQKSLLKVIVGITLFIVIGVGYVFRDAILGKRTLTTRWTEDARILFRNPVSQTKGVLVLDNYFEESSSHFIDAKGRLSRKVPGSFLTVLSDGSYFSFLDGELFYWSPTGALNWKRKVHFHHDVYLNEKSGSFFVLSGDNFDRKGESKPTRYDSIVGFNLKGDTIFEWKLSDHMAEIERIVGNAIPRTEGEFRYYYTHLNSVQEIEENQLSAQNPAFAPGNILVNDWATNIFFVIDRNTKKIVWHSDPDKRYKVHSLRLLPDGRMIFLRNLADGVDWKDQYSSVAYYDPIAKSAAAEIVFEPLRSFFTHAGGTLQILNDRRFLVTESHRGKVFEVDANGKIFFEWVYPQSSSEKPMPVYRVQWIPEDYFKKSFFSKSVEF